MGADLQVSHIAGGCRYAIEACWRVDTDMAIEADKRMGADMAIEADIYAGERVPRIRNPGL